MKFASCADELLPKRPTTNPPGVSSDAPINTDVGHDGATASPRPVAASIAAVTMSKIFIGVDSVSVLLEREIAFPILLHVHHGKGSGTAAARKRVREKVSGTFLTGEVREKVLGTFLTGESD
ncbi:MAG: hypothetical protein ACREVT_12205 [Burkholderiales bacterium]